MTKRTGSTSSIAVFLPFPHITRFQYFTLDSNYESYVHQVICFFFLFFVVFCVCGSMPLFIQINTTAAYLLLARVFSLEALNLETSPCPCVPLAHHTP